MEFYEEKSFLEKVLPDLVAGEDLRVLFATYKNVRGYEDGEVKTGRNDLRIFVQNGDLDYSGPVMGGLAALLCGDMDAALKAERLMKDEGQEAQRVMESCYPEISEHLKDSGNFMVVVYASVSAFDENIGFALKVKEDWPHAKVVIVTCDCIERKKREKLSTFKGGEIHSVVISSECGGRGVMRDILEEIISLWQKTNENKEIAQT